MSVPTNKTSTDKPKTPKPEILKVALTRKKKAFQKKINEKKNEHRRSGALKQIAMRNAQRYAKEYRTEHNRLITNRRIAKNTGNFFVEPEAKVVFVVRIRGINGVSPKVRKALQLLRLRQINNATFVKVNKATLQILKLVEPYVTYGSPSQQTVQNLIYKRGYGKVNHQRKALNDNTIVQKKLGSLGVNCIDDVVHEIFTVGPNFKQVNNFLWPFKLPPPLGGYKKIANHFVEGGDAGNREHFINDLVKQMN